MTIMDKEQRVHKIFNTISKDYDHMNNIISFNQHTLWRNKTMSHMFLNSDMTVLDVCCGTGDWTIQLAKSGADTTGLDFSENMLEVAKDKTDELRNISLIHGNAMDLPFEDNHFDYVTIGFGLRNLPDYDAAIADFYRVLKPGGTLVILETSSPENSLINSGFQLYFGKIMPVLGGMIAKRKDEYTWLYESTNSFLSKNELKKMLQTTGFTNIKILPHTFGTAASHFAIKPIDEG